MANKYNVPMRMMHWLMSILIIGMIASGWYMEGLPNDDPYKYDVWYSWHKSFGFTLLMLLVVRIIIRLSSKVPATPAKLAPWEKYLSHIGHFLLYAFMLMVPISGIIYSDAGGHGIDFFFTEFSFLTEDKEFSKQGKELHGIFPYVLLGIVVLHVAGALKHRFFDKDPEVDVLKRML